MVGLNGFAFCCDASQAGKGLELSTRFWAEPTMASFMGEGDAEVISCIDDRILRGKITPMRPPVLDHYANMDICRGWCQQPTADRDQTAERIFAAAVRRC